MNLIKSVVLINILKLCVAFDNEYDDYLNNMDYSNIDINRVIYETDISDLKVKLKSFDKIYVSEIDEDALDKICQLDLLIVRTSENDVIYCRDVRKYRTKRDSQDDEGSGDLEFGSGMDEGEMEGVKELTTVSGDAQEGIETLDNNETKEYGPSVEPPLANNDDKEGEMPTMSSRFGENTDNEATDDEVVKEQDTNITNVNENVTPPPPIAEPPEPSTTITSGDNEGVNTSEADPETQDKDENISTQPPSNEDPEDTKNGDKDIDPTTTQSINEILKHIEREVDEPIPNEASESHTTGRSRSIIPVPGDVNPDLVDGKSSSDSSDKVEETNRTLLDAGNQSDKNTTSDTRSMAAPANAGSISGLNVLIIIVVLVALAGAAAFGYSKYQKRKVQYNVVNAEEEGKEMKEIKRYENAALKDVSEGKPLVDGDVVCIEMEKPHTPSPTPRTFAVTPIPIKKANNEDEENDREDEGANDIHTDNVNKTP